MYSALLLGAAFMVGAPDAKDPPKNDPRIVGAWALENAIAGGKERPAPKGETLFTFTAEGRLKVTDNGESDDDDSAYKLDAKKDPQEITLFPPKGGANILGIFAIKGETLTICIGAGKGVARPTKFESPEGSEILLMTFKRAKK